MNYFVQLGVVIHQYLTSWHNIVHDLKQMRGSLPVVLDRQVVKKSDHRVLKNPTVSKAPSFHQGPLLEVLNSNTIDDVLMYPGISNTVILNNLLSFHQAYISLIHTRITPFDLCLFSQRCPGGSSGETSKVCTPHVYWLGGTFCRFQVCR